MSPSSTSLFSSSSCGSDAHCPSIRSVMLILPLVALVWDLKGCLLPHRSSSSGLTPNPEFPKRFFHLAGSVHGTIDVNGRLDGVTHPHENEKLVALTHPCGQIPSQPLVKTTAIHVKRIQAMLKGQKFSNESGFDEHDRVLSSLKRSWSP